MLKKMKLGGGALLVGAVLVLSGVLPYRAEAALPAAVQSQLEAGLATGSTDAKVQRVVDLATANPDLITDIAAAVAALDPDLAPPVAAALANLLPDQDAKNAMVLAIIRSLGENHEDVALEKATEVVAAVPGSEGVLETILATASGGPFGDPRPESLPEPVGRTFQNQTFDQIPFFDEVQQTSVTVQSTSPAGDDQVNDEYTDGQIFAE